MTYGYCTYHELECDYRGNCIDCPHNDVEDTEWFRQDEERTESEEIMGVKKKITNAKPSNSLFKELAETMTEEEIQEIVTEAKEKAREQISEIESEHAVLCNNFTESSQDCISRKAVNKLKKYRFSYDTNTTIPKSDVFVKISDITNLPSVNPPRPEGKWIHNNCSICNYNVNPWNNTPYCPNCGAKMEESEDIE